MLLVDLQNGTCGPPQAELRADFHKSFQAHTLPAARRAMELSRQAGLEVMHTVMANLTADGRDRSLDYKRCGLGFPPRSWEARLIDELAPLADEILLPKSSSSPFHSTCLDYVLRNIGIQDLVVAGILTDQCIDHTVKDAADRGYRVTCLTDACQAETPERHTAALACFRGYARQCMVEEFATGLSRPERRAE